MNTLKLSLEKPGFIWIAIVIIYSVLFWTQLRHAPLTESEQSTYRILQQFAQGDFPPKIGLIRTVPDWGHLAYYALVSRIEKIFPTDVKFVRAAGLACTLIGLLVFIWLGRHFTYRNRLSPFWVSLSTLLLAVNPYTWRAAFEINPLGLFFVLILLSLYFFEKEQLAWSAVLLSLAILVDWWALLLAVTFVLQRLTQERGKLLRPERGVALLMPFVAGALPFFAWKGLIPKGEVEQWWMLLRSKTSLFHLENLFYGFALLPIYGLFFTWAWGLRARTRALAIGAVVTGVCIPLYFVFPIHFDVWNMVRFGLEVPLGLVDQAFVMIAGPYKNLVLFVFWLAGLFLFIQLFLMDILDQSRGLRYFITLFFMVQPFAIGFGDHYFWLVVPFLLLFSLSEALVGEEGKLA